MAERNRGLHGTSAMQTGSPVENWYPDMNFFKKKGVDANFCGSEPFYLFPNIGKTVYLLSLNHKHTGMGVLDSEKVDKIKRILKWHQRGMTISDLASEMKMNRNLVAKYLDMLLISGHVEMQLIGAAKVYFLAQRVPISALLEFSSDLVIVVDSEQKILQVNEQVPTLLDMPREALIRKRTEEIAHPFMQALVRNWNTRDPKDHGEHVTDTSLLDPG